MWNLPPFAYEIIRSVEATTRREEERARRPRPDDGIDYVYRIADDFARRIGRPEAIRALEQQILMAVAEAKIRAVNAETLLFESSSYIPSSDTAVVVADCEAWLARNRAGKVEGTPVQTSAQEFAVRGPAKHQAAILKALEGLGYRGPTRQLPAFKNGTKSIKSKVRDLLVDRPPDRMGDAVFNKAWSSLLADGQLKHPPASDPKTKKKHQGLGQSDARP